MSCQFNEPLRALEQTLSQHKLAVQQWFAAAWLEVSPPVYGSIDLRNAGFKCAPVDMNLFPAGFNNLSEDALTRAKIAAKKILSRLAPKAKRILLIPENHTRNALYLKNIEVLQQLLQEAGFEVRTSMLTESLVRHHDRLQMADFDPDIILLNNDLATGMHPLLQGLAQPIFPPAQLGWHQRLKSDHFRYYQNIVTTFAKQFGFDAWLITPLFRYCESIDFVQQEGIAHLTETAESLFTEVKKKYADYQIQQPPFLIIKADQGTYGMAVMTVRHIEELHLLNRKRRSHMAKSKGGQTVRRVIVQEGIPTFDTVGKAQHVAEPVVYLWGECAVGGFYRTHENRGIDENLNTPGMQFQSFPLEQCTLYEIIAELSMLAAAKEIACQPLA